MIVALVGSAASPAAAERLGAQLARLPDRVRARVTTVTASGPERVLGELAALARRAAEDGEGLAVVAGDLVTSDRPVLEVLDDPRPAARALVIDEGNATTRSVARAGTRVVAAGSERHGLAAAGVFAGVLSVPVVDVARAAAAWASAAEVAARWPDLDPVQGALVAVVRAGIAVTAVPAGPYVAVRGDPDALAHAVGLDEDDLTWRRASRPGDGVWSTFALRPVSRRISRRAVRAGVTPNQVTGVGFLLGLIAALLVGLGANATIVAGALLLQVALVLDCVDGEIARTTRGFTAFGAWADLVTDRVKEYAVLAAVALAGHDLWPLALAGLLLQLTRHMADYAFADTLLPFWRRPRIDTRPFAETDPPDGIADQRPAGRLGLLHWVKQAAHMQIGERWLVLTVCLLVGVGVGGPQVALIGYVAIVAFGLAWVLVGWTARTLTGAARRTALPDPIARVLAALRDDGPLPLGLRRRPVVWPLPMLVTALEGAALLAGTAVTAYVWLPAAFGWAAAVAWHRYDLFYRSRAGRVPVPRWVAIASGGWALRTAVLALGAATDVLPWVLPIGTGVVVLATVPESLWRAFRPPRDPGEGPPATGGVGVRARLAVAQKSLRRAVAVPVTRMLMRVTRPRPLALVAGLPDAEENSLATAAVLATRYRGDVVLVANDPPAARVLLDRVGALLGTPSDRVRIVAKRGLATYRLFVRARVVAYTHGLYDSPVPVGARLHVNLWHGTGPKWNANANFAQHVGAQAHAASSPLWGYEAIRALSMGASTRIVAGNPRQDVLDASTDRSVLSVLGLDPDRPLVLWLPTFRTSARAGLVGLTEGEPLDPAAGRAFAAAAAAHGVQLVAKPHRLDADRYAELGLPVLSTDQLLEAGTTLYALLGLAHGLISDYSSVWVDLLESDASIGLYVPDLEVYQRARGLNRPHLPVAAGGLFLDVAGADGFFADVAAGRVWHADGLRAARARIESIDVTPGARTTRMLEELAVLARERFGDDLGLA